MRGAWRPWVTYGTPVLVLFLYMMVSDPLPPAQASTLAPVVLLSGGAFVGALIRLSSRPVDRFLKGLHEAGEAFEVVSDDVSWFGERRLRARSALGEWRIATSPGKYVEVYVRTPGMRRRQRVRGDMRRLARECVEKIRAGESWPKLTVP